MEAFLAIISIISYVKITDAIPPPQCFANFRWDDCGQSPQPVMYYWKPGSRCEVGIWRGCLPNVNMFKDEYECVSTCIFSVRAQAPDWHLLKQEDATTTEPTTTVGVFVNQTMEAGTAGGGTGGTGAGGDGTTVAGEAAEGAGAGGAEGGEGGEGAGGAGGNDTNTDTTAPVTEPA